mmetsp:Transcript_55983/g.130885  ORF Transcript_55983/g.130885 Transcript_55983/m.130885 type:complete len:1026 (-) Transcript_55983:71-3148(-)
MPSGPHVRLEADGLPSVDFAVKSPNVDVSSSEEEQTGIIQGVAAAPHESVVPHMRVGDVPATEMDPSASTPREKLRVPGSPPPLDMDGAAEPSASHAPSPLPSLRTMPSPLRAGRRSLSPRSPHEARTEILDRSRAPAIPENSENVYERPRESRGRSVRAPGEPRSFMDDSLAGTSPRTEHSMESLADFFRQGRYDMPLMGASPDTEHSVESLAEFFHDGHYVVPLRVSSIDEPIAEPVQQPPDSHLDRSDSALQSCEHGTPCVASFPCPLTCGGPGRVGPPAFGAPAFGRRPVPTPGPELPTASRPVREVDLVPVGPSSAPDSMRNVRASAPRVPAPTEHVEIPSLEAELRPVPTRSLPCPTRAPAIDSSGHRDAVLPPMGHLPGPLNSGVPRAEPPEAFGQLPTSARAGGAVRGVASRIGDSIGFVPEAVERGQDVPDLRTSGPMQPTLAATQPVTNPALSISSATPSWGLPGSGHVASGPMASGPMASARMPTRPVQGPPAAQVPMYTSTGHAGPPFQREVGGVGFAPPPPVPKGNMPAFMRPCTQGPMAPPAPAPWPTPTSMPLASVPQAPGPPISVSQQPAPLQPPFSTVGGEVHSAGKMPPVSAAGARVDPSTTLPDGERLSQGPAPPSQELRVPEPRAPTSSGPMLPPEAGPVEHAKDLPEDIGMPTDIAPEALAPGDQPAIDRDAPPSPLGRSPSPTAGVPGSLDVVVNNSPEITTPPPPEVVEKGQQTTPDKQQLVQRRKRPAQEKLRVAKDGPFKLVNVSIDQIKSLNKQGRPQRHHIRVLEHWRNERVVYERVPGSSCPTVSGLVVAQTSQVDGSEQRKECSPLKLTPKFDDVFSPRSLKSDITFQAQGREEDAGSDVAPRAKAPKHRSRVVAPVERAARAASAEAAAALAARAPSRALPQRTPTGFVEVPAAEGSTHACGIRVGLENGNWMCCDIRIPPRSFNTPEELASNKSLLIYVTTCEPGTLTAAVNMDIIEMSTGHSMVIRSGQDYCLRNISAATTAQLKMVLINQTS